MSADPEEAASASASASASVSADTDGPSNPNAMVVVEEEDENPKSSSNSMSESSAPPPPRGPHIGKQLPQHRQPAAATTGGDEGGEGEKKKAFEPRDLLPKGRGEVLCRFCGKDVGAGCRIKCAECMVDLCLECFSAGVKIDGHDPHHRYRIPDALSFPIFDKDWTAAEEIKLLDAVQRYGLGNWEGISTQTFGKAKTARQIRDHYLDDYFGWQGCFLPPNIMSPAPPRPAGEESAGRAVASSEDFVYTPLPPVEGCLEKREGLPVISNFLATQSMSDIEGRSCTEDGAARRLSLESVGILANEDSVYSTSTPSGEKGLSAIGASGIAGTGSKSSKKERKTTAALQSHIATLPGADLVGYMPLRGDFDTEHDQDAEHILADLEFLSDDDESERKLKHEVIAIYNKRLDERDRRKRLVMERGLLDYKKLQAADRKRSPDERELVARLRVFARFHTAEEHDKFVESVLCAKRLRKRIERLQSWRKLGLRTLKEGAAFEEERKARADEAARQGSSYLIDATANGKSTAANRESRYMAREGGTMPDSDTTLAVERAALMENPGAESLSDREIDMCVTLKLTPRQYLSCKNCMIRESASKGWLDKSAASRLVKIDATMSSAAYDFFVSCGWVSMPPSGVASASEQVNGGEASTPVVTSFEQ